MNQLIKKITTLILMFFFINCSVNQLIKRNHLKTKTLFEELFVKYNNAFSVQSTYINTSYVWSNYNDSIIVFKLQNGKITDSFNKFNTNKFLKKKIENIF